MLEDKKLIRKYERCLFAALLFLLVGNLIVEFNLLDLGYLILIIVTALRYTKMKLDTQ